MFWRVLWKLFRASRGRLGVALLALGSGAAVCSALINLQLDAERKLTREFRALGANVIVSPLREARAAGNESPPLMSESVYRRIGALRSARVVAVAPYLYLVARSPVVNAAEQRVIVSGSPCELEAFTSRLARALPGFEVRPVRQLAEAEGHLLGRIRVLILSAVILILALTTLCVLATMAALAMERRRDVGLMKALGGSMSRVFRLFLTEAGSLGVVGGLLGYVVGILLSEWMGRRVF